MPHITVHIRTGTTEQTKQDLAQAITQQVVAITHCEAQAVSVAIAEVEPSNWKKQVYDPLIQGAHETLYTKPGYIL